MTFQHRDRSTLLAEFWITGLPAPFSTRGERRWKEAIEQTVSPKGQLTGEKGIDLGFYLPGPDFGPRSPDLDNLCEPVFSVLINHLKWFEGRRPNMLWWRATKRYGNKQGCHVRLLSGVALEFVSVLNQLILEAIFEGPLPQSALDQRMLGWSRSFKSSKKPGTLGRYKLLLRFGDSSLNIGEIATGPVKSTIDCLVPFLGGESGKPEDWRITALQVEKGVAKISRLGVEVLLWRMNQ